MDFLVGRLPPGQRALQLQWERFCCVALGVTLQSPVLHHVTENHFETVWHAMRRCVERGYRRIGFVVSAPDDSPNVGSRWLSAYLGQQDRLDLPALGCRFAGSKTATRLSFDAGSSGGHRMCSLSAMRVPC